MPTERSVKVKIDAEISGFERAMARAAAETEAFKKELNDSNSGASGLVQSIVALAPAIVPLGAAAVPAIAGITAGLGAAAAAAGVTALAFHGVGDALDKLNKYQLDPSKANLKAMHLAMKQLPESGREFVHFLDGLEPKLKELRATAQRNMFFGLESGMRQLVTLEPQVKRVIATISSAVGEIASNLGGDMAHSSTLHAFFNYIDRTARPILTDMAKVLENVAGGFANLVMDMDPLTRSFSEQMLTMSSAFSKWAAGLSGTKGFQDFLDYVHTSGPMVGQALGAVADALLQVVEAAAPVGQAVLPVITDLAKVLAVIADSPVGTPLIAAAAGLAALGRAVALFNAAKASSVGTMFASLKSAETRGPAIAMGLGAMAIGVGALADKSTGAGKAVSALSDIAGGAMIGFSMGGPWGAAIGAGAGALAGLSQASDDAGLSFKRTKEDTKDFVGTLDGLTGAATQATRALASQKLQQDGTFAAAKNLGIATRDLVSATLGQKGAQDRVNAAYRDGKKQLDEMIKSGHGGSKAATELADSLDKVRGETGYYTASLSKAERQQRAAGAATMTWTQALKGVPKKVQAELKNLNYDPTMKQVQALKKQYDLTPKQVRTILRAIDNASGTVSHLKSVYAGLPRHLETQIVTTHVDKFERQTQAHASGGYITGPGTATSDSIPAYLSNGEYVIKAAAVERYGKATFDRLNAMAFANGGLVQAPPMQYAHRVQAFAQGGPVGAAAVPDAGVVAEIRALRAALQQQGILIQQRSADAIGTAAGNATGRTINHAAASAQRRR